MLTPPTARKNIAAIMILTLSGCATTPQIAVDPKSVTNLALYKQDMLDCKIIAESYDLSDSTGKNALVGAATGGVVVAGIATAIAGAVFAPAIPFIIAGSAAGAGAGGGSTKIKEATAREKILGACMTERGYKVFSPN